MERNIISMEIIKKDFDGIEYYLIDVYDDEFYFGTVYHFESDMGSKYCFCQNDTYIPIESKKYLKKIRKALEFNSDIMYRKNQNKDLIGIRIEMLSQTDILDILEIFKKIERMEQNEEYKLYNEVSNAINELYPDISYEDTMKVLNDNSGIYFLKLPFGNLGNYFINTNRIYLDSSCKVSKKLKDTILHESIHKSTNRNGFIKNNAKKFRGLIEAGTAKICENIYGDKTSHKIFVGYSEIHMNFSIEAYDLAQIIYRQMAQLVDTQMADKELIKGSFDIFLNQFEKMYGKDLLLYLSHRTNRLINNSLSEKKQLKYLEQAQNMLLTKAFDKKILNVETEEDMINYLTELKEFEYCIARINDNDTFFKNYYTNKYNYIINLAKTKKIDLSKMEKFEYSPVEFYPIRNNPKSTLLEITEKHIENICKLQPNEIVQRKFDLEKCTRMQINNFPNGDCLDIILQNGIPISSVCWTESNNILMHDKNSMIYQDLGVDYNNAKIYEIANNTYMVINNDETSETYSKSSETSKVYKNVQNQINLGFSLKDLEESMIPTYVIECDTDNISYLLNKLKNFFNRIKTLALPYKINEQINTTDEDSADSKKYQKRRNAFLNQLDPNNEFYNENSVASTEKLNTNNKETTRSENIESTR